MVAGGLKMEPVVQGDAMNVEPQNNGESAEREWDEERLEESLKSLQEMYRQLRNLRSTIPRLIAPLTTKQPSPEVLYQKFTASVQGANSEVKEFRTLVESEQSRQILQHAVESRSQNPKGIKSWKITEHPEWFEKRTGDS